MTQLANNAANRDEWNARQIGEIDDATKLLIADGALGELAYVTRLARGSAGQSRRSLTARLRAAVYHGLKSGLSLRERFKAVSRAIRPSPGQPRPLDPPRRIRSLMKNGESDRAAALAAALLSEKGNDEDFMQAATTAFARVGAISLQLQAIQARRKLADSEKLARNEAALVSRLRETDPNWLPEIRDGGVLNRQSDGRAVLHLLKASLPHRQSGYTMRSTYLLKSQQAAGLNPVVMTPLGFPEGSEGRSSSGSEEVDGIAHYRLVDDSTTGDSDAFDTYLNRYAETAAPWVADLSPNLIHAHSGHRGYDAALVGLALARHFDLPYVYEVRGFFESLWSRDPVLNEKGEYFSRRLRAEARCMREADAVVTLSETMADEIASRGVSRENVFIVPNGVDTDVFQPVAAPTGLSARWSLDGQFVFGYVSNLDHWREGQETLIEAVAYLRAHSVNATALIVGDGKRSNELQEFAKSTAPPGSVVFTGAVPHAEVLSYYALMDVFVVPRVSERAARLVTPLKPLEAMAAGLPVVTSNLPVLEEMIGHGERGRSFKAGNPGDLADTLRTLAEDNQTRNALSVNGRAWVVDNRQWSLVGPTYKEIYDRILSK